ncbi:hypothetical protein PHYSODRAFT_468341, partial [Phytophthora sojae]
EYEEEQSEDSEEGVDSNSHEDSDEEDALTMIGPRSGVPVEVKYDMPRDLPFVQPYEGGDFFFVRECYDVYYVLVEKLLLEGKRCVTLTGTRGIGKSIFYAYFFDRFRREHQGEGWIVVASSYKKSGEVPDMAVFEEGKEPNIIRVAIPEALGKMALCLAGVTAGLDDELQERFWNFGGVAQNCLNLDFEAIPKAIHDLTEPIAHITDRGDLKNLLVGNNDTRHRFLHYQPISTGRRKTTKLVSDMICEKLSDELLQVTKGRINDVKLMLMVVPEVVSLYGWVFEGSAHAILQGGLKMSARPLAAAGAQKTVFTISSTAGSAVFKTEALAPSLLTSSGPYHKPKSKILDSIDGFYFSKEVAKLTGELRGEYMEKEPILLFQMSVPKVHPMRASGIIYVLRKLGLLETVEENHKRAAIIFLHPAAHASAFQRQKIIVSGGSPRSIEEARGIGPLTQKTLAMYGVKTVEELKDGINAFRDGKIIMQDHS